MMDIQTIKDTSIFYTFKFRVRLHTQWGRISLYVGKVQISGIVERQ